MKKIGYQGVRGCYSEQASKIFFRESIEFKQYKTFRDVFEGLKNEEIDFAVLPIRNSITGGIREVMDLLFEEEAYVIGEVTLKIEHVLIGFPESSLNEIEYVYSHPEALSQCKNFLEKMNFKIIPSFDTAGSVMEVKSSGKRNSAAIASKYAAERYGMKVLRENIQDSENNYTQFFILRRDLFISDGSDKTSLIFITEHKPGALYKALEAFAKRNINMLHLESRPIKDQPWNYSFYVDIEGNLRDRKISEALKDLRENTLFIKVIGSYKSKW